MMRVWQVEHNERQFPVDREVLFRYGDDAGVG
jgi:hypothetical protein